MGNRKEMAGETQGQSSVIALHVAYPQPKRIQCGGIVHLLPTLHCKAKSLHSLPSSIPFQGRANAEAVGDVGFGVDDWLDKR